MSTARKLEWAVARAASRHVKIDRVGDAVNAFAKHVREKMPDLKGTFKGPRGQLVPETEKFARDFFEQHAKENPDVAREVPNDIAANAKRDGLDWNG